VADSQVAEETKRRLTFLKKEIEEETGKAISKLPQSADKLAHESALARAREEAFANVARRESACPSKDQGGDVGWFPRLGSMIEPFARAAFSLQPFEMSEIVQTPFGFHLIMVTDRKPGKEAKFQDVKDIVRDVYAQRLREAMIAQLKPQANIVINASGKK
jgi:parvulin-like peptidyl-prolyl isomerase